MNISRGAVCTAVFSDPITALLERSPGRRDCREQGVTMGPVWVMAPAATPISIAGAVMLAIFMLPLSCCKRAGAVPASSMLPRSG